MGLSGEVVDVLVDEFVPAAVQPLVGLFMQACSLIRVRWKRGIINLLRDCCLLANLMMRGCSLVQTGFKLSNTNGFNG